MSLTVKKFNNNNFGISVSVFIDGKQNVWLKGKDIALALGYECPTNAIRDHVEEK